MVETIITDIPGQHLLTDSFGFYHLITNPTDIGLTAVVELHNDTILERTQDYLHSVLIGDGKIPYCPFVAAIEAGNGYYVCEFGQRDPPIAQVISILESEFRAHSPHPTHQRQNVDITSVVATFSHPAASTSGFCRSLDAARDKYRQRILDRGLMMSQMHPFHPGGHASAAKLGSSKRSDELYRAAIPLLIVRRMHQEDLVFMRTPEEIATYASFFPIGDATLYRYNERLAAQFRQHPFFVYAASPEFQQEGAQQAFMSIMLYLSRKYQSILSLREQYADDKNYQTVFAKHFNEERGHDADLAEDIRRIYGRVDELDNGQTGKALDKALSYFSERMVDGSDAERLLLSLTVMEGAAAEFYRIMAPLVRLDTSHFRDHDDADGKHYLMGKSLLEGLSAEEYAQLLLAQREGYRRMQSFFDIALVTMQSG